MKTLEFFYEETEIHFLVNPLDKNVMVNATEMAKIFKKETRVFLKTEHAKAFIKVAEKELNQAPNGAQLNDKRAPYGAQIIEDRGRNGIYFDRCLALKFAAWLSPEFEFWIYHTIDNIVFGNYKKHWDAHARQESARVAMENLKVEIMHSPTKESVQAYFEQETAYRAAKNAKSTAIRNQLKLFGNDEPTFETPKT